MKIGSESFTEKTTNADHAYNLNNKKKKKAFMPSTTEALYQKCQLLVISFVLYK